MRFKNIFWLHVKKSAGITTRALLSPHYVEVDRARRPKNFIQAEFHEYNDILNNFRVVLGEYQFRRSLFAKRYLYKEQWEKMFSFAFAREPIDRCISMFFYLYWNNDTFLKKMLRPVQRTIQTKKLQINTSYAFDAFLDCVQEARVSESIFLPLDLHFTTHTAPMWDDVTDEDGNILLSAIFRLENLAEGVNTAFEECGIEKRVEMRKRSNINKSRKPLSPTKSQRNKIVQVYSKDLELFESAI